MKLVYIAAPYHADTPEKMENNRQTALASCEEAYRLGRLQGIKIVPVTPLGNFSYLNENSQDEREQALHMGIALLSRCDELWVAGDHISEGMREEIQAAVRLEKPVYSMGMEQQKIQAAITGMPPMLDEKCCYKNSEQKDYSGQLLVLKASVLAPWMLDPRNQLWIAENGFGTKPNASGRAVFATCLMDGERARFNREDFYGIANPNRLPDFAKEKLSENQQNIDESEEFEP